jgi:hypothetical protein
LAVYSLNLIYELSSTNYKEHLLIPKSYFKK